MGLLASRHILSVFLPYPPVSLFVPSGLVLASRRLDLRASGDRRIYDKMINQSGRFHRGCFSFTPPSIHLSLRLTRTSLWLNMWTRSTFLLSPHAVIMTHAPQAETPSICCLWNSPKFTPGCSILTCLCCLSAVVVVVQVCPSVFKIISIIHKARAVDICWTLCFHSELFLNSTSASRASTRSPSSADSTSSWSSSTGRLEVRAS